MSKYEQTCQFWLDIWENENYGSRTDTPAYRTQSEIFVNEIAPFLYGVGSFCELGVGNGRNVFCFHKKFPEWEYRANDINPDTFAVIARHYPDVLDYCSVVISDTLTYLKNCKQADLIFTHGHLMHIPDDAIEEICSLMEQRANKFICIYEAHSHTGNPSLKISPDYRFERDYRYLFNLEIVLSYLIKTQLGVKQQLILFKK